MSKKLISLLLSLLLVMGAVGVPAGASPASPSPAPTPEPTIDLYLYNSQADATIKTITATIGQPYAAYLSGFTPPIPTGYDFKGWTLTENGTESNKLSLNTAVSGTGKFIFVYAIFTPKTVSVTYDYGYDRGGGKGSTETHNETFDAAYTNLPKDNPTRNDGYSFVGWFDSKSGGNLITDSSLVKKETSHTIFAQWTAQKVTVKLYYNTDDGSTPVNPKETLTLAYGSTVKSIRKPTRTGYICTWKNKGGSAISEDSAITSELELEAVWTPNEYTITFNPNGGKLTSSTSELKATYGSLYSSISGQPTAKRNGYNFGGWSTSQNGPELSADAIVTGNQVLYAIWTGKSKDIGLKYNLPDNSTNGPADGTLSVKFGTTINNLPAPSSSALPQYSDTDTTKYGFAGWYTLAKDDEFDPSNPDKELKLGHLIENGYVYNGEFTELHARWTYTVTLDANGGTPATQTKTFTTGTAVDSLPKPTKDGYDFEGWYTGENGGNIVTSDTIPDVTKKTLYAKWKTKSIDVIYDANNGKFDNGEDKKTISIPYDTSYTLPSPAPTRTGYTFEGWYTSKDGGTKVTSETKVNTADKHTLYAHWKAKAATLTIEYNFPDGFDDTAYKRQELTKNEIYLEEKFNVTGLPLNPPSFTYDGATFEFAGWYTTKTDSADSKGKQVNRENSLTEDMVDNSLRLTLYARWRFSVGFYERHNSTSPAKNIVFTTGSAYGDNLYTPTRDGFTFMGWYDSPVEDNTIPSGRRIEKGAAADPKLRKLYAAWSTSEYAVTPDANGGKFSDEQTIPWAFNHGDTYGRYVTDSAYVPAPPVGRTFDGWYTEKEGGTKLSASDKVTATRTIFAHWKPIQYTLTLDLNYPGAADITKSVDYDTELKKALPSPDPDRTGYAFEGWFDAEEGGKPADTSVKVTANRTLYAHWTEAEKVELDVNGGKLPDGHPSHIYVYTGGDYQKLPEPTWAGNLFKGWYTAKEGGDKVERSDKVFEPIPKKLYARWEAREITVKLSYNGAPNDPGRTITCKVGDTYRRLPLRLTWGAYEFMGWYTQAVGGDKVEQSDTVTVASDDVKELTLYAHWGYKVSFDPGKGDGEMEPVAAEMNQPYTLPACTFNAPDGMRFGGWAIGTPDGPKQASGSQYTVVRNLALYATWTDKPITITVTCTSGGSLATTDNKTNTVTVERGADVTFLARANTGYELKDLQVDGVSFNFTEEYTFRNVVEDHTIHAVFGRVGAPAYTSCDRGISCPLSAYRDLDPRAWYHDAVHFCMDSVIMNGNGNSFNPNTRATRAEVATSLWSAEGREPLGGNGPLGSSYTDVPVSEWYYQPIEWATRNHVLAGYGNGKFGPNDSITREQLVAILWRHAGYPKPRSTVLRFNDASQVSGFAWDAMLWATEQGIIAGRPGGYLAPKGNATRADVAQVLKNYLN